MIFETHYFQNSSSYIDAFVSYLLEQSAGEASIDLGDTLILLPTQRSTRIFLERFVQQCNLQNKKLTSPPDRMTPGGFIKHVFDRENQFVTDITRSRIWVQVLQTNSDLLKELLKAAPLPTTQIEWLRLADKFDTLRSELLGNLISLESVIDAVEKLALDNEVARWECINQLVESYSTAVSERGLIDPFTGRIEELGTVVLKSCRIYVAGCVELPEIVRHVLRNNNKAVSLFIAAEQSLSQHFDDYGCILANNPIPAQHAIPDTAVSIVEHATDQAAALAVILEREVKQSTSEELVLASCDEQTWITLEQDMRTRGLSLHPAAGKMLNQTQLFLFIKALSSYCKDSTYQHFASLVRLPDVEQYCLSALIERFPNISIDIPTIVDRYYNTHLPVRLSTARSVTGDSDKRFTALCMVVHDLIGSFLHKKQSAGEWIADLNSVFQALYTYELTEKHAELIETCEVLARYNRDLLECPLSSGIAFTGSDFCEFLLFLAREHRIPAQPESSSIDLVGWLELQLDPASFVILTDVVEGCLPTSMNADMFLPNSLREQLGLPCNSRRFARDAYLFNTLVHSNKKIHFIVNRKLSNGEYAFPSRFLCSGDDWRSFGTFLAGHPMRFEHQMLAPESDRSQTDLPEPELPVQIDTVSVTSLKTYLACPYEYYLKHVLKLSVLSDNSRELNPLQFGELIHVVLEQFAATEYANSHNEILVAQTINTLLNEYVTHQFTTAVEPAVLVQVEQARVRLAAFAKVHCARVLEGWLIEHTEFDFKIPIAIGAAEVLLRGRIDRIERNQKTGMLAVLDYKTGEEVKSPDAVHRKKIFRTDQYRWIDLQLPAYIFALRTLGYTEDIQSGYFSLESSIDKIGVSTASWSEEDQQEAIICLKETITNIKNQQFWPPQKIPDNMNPLARLYLDFTLEAEQ